jgi:hypothetical protein
MTLHLTPYRKAPSTHSTTHSTPSRVAFLLSATLLCHACPRGGRREEGYSPRPTSFYFRNTPRPSSSRELGDWPGARVSGLTHAGTKFRLSPPAVCSHVLSVPAACRRCCYNPNANPAPPPTRSALPYHHHTYVLFFATGPRRRRTYRPRRTHSLHRNSIPFPLSLSLFLLGRLYPAVSPMTM